MGECPCSNSGENCAYYSTQLVLHTETIRVMDTLLIIASSPLFESELSFDVKPRDHCGLVFEDCLLRHKLQLHSATVIKVSTKTRNCPVIRGLDIDKQLPPTRTLAGYLRILVFFTTRLHIINCCQ